MPRVTVRGESSADGRLPSVAVKDFEEIISLSFLFILRRFSMEETPWSLFVWESNSSTRGEEGGSGGGLSLKLVEEDPNARLFSVVEELDCWRKMLLMLFFLPPRRCFWGMLKEEAVADSGG